ncbi:hypothetical protein [Reichenbachiella sp.]|uniref:toxin-antitoxin system YwqK family antitoxin n=1 Tax=Reichenbachiella sp. TaxID=2184521 RepID=UPI003299B2E6
MSLHFRSIFLIGTSLSILLMADSSFGQTREVETYYDLGRTKIHEYYTTLNEPPYQKHGVYKEFDAAGNLIRYKEFNNGKQHGMVRVYYFIPDYSQKACYGKLIGESQWNNGQKHGWDKTWICHQGTLVLESEIYFEDGRELKGKYYHENGALRAENVSTGINKEWDQNSNLIAEYEVVNGIENGLKKLWYSNGQLKAEGQTAEGFEIGRWVSYFENGNLKSEVELSSEKPFPTSQIEYFSNGNIKYSLKETSNGNYMVEDYLENGNLSVRVNKTYDSHSKELFLNGNLEIYNAENQIVAGGNYVDGCKVGPFTILYDENWKEVFNHNQAAYKRVLKFDQNCKPSGLVTDYHINGIKQFEGYMVSLEPESLDGLCTYFYSNGNKQEEKTFKYGTPIKIVKYYEHGPLQMEANYSKGKLDGDVKYYDENGTLRQSEQYSLGLKTGEWKYFSDNGTLLEVERYRFDQLVDSKTMN